jgi:membrane fusion protein, multidrug efflux system
MRIWFCLFAGLCAIGCSHGPEAAPPSAPTVTVAVPLERTVQDFKDFTGRTDAVETVSVRARVSGYITKIPFKEGTEVKKGDVLFEIDVRPYKAVLDQATGQLEQAKAAATLAEANYKRAKELANQRVSAISKQDLDTSASQYATSKGQLETAQANVDSAQLNVDFCTVRAAIDGRVSRYLITVGNLVSQDQTVLTTIVSQDPMYAYFDVDEQTLLQVQQLIREGRMKSARTSSDVPVLMELSDEQGFPHRGSINFVDNRVDPATGTLQVRGLFNNPIVKGSRMLSPGLFVRTRVFLGEPYQALLIPQDAVVSDQGQDSVYLVNAQDEVENRKVNLGQLHEGLRAVMHGLAANERIIIRGLQRVRPGAKVRPKLETVQPLATPDDLPIDKAPSGAGKQPAEPNGPDPGSSRMEGRPLGARSKSGRAGGQTPPGAMKPGS